MVLEHLFPENWLEQRLRYAFLLAVVYSAVAIVLARLLFAANSGIVSVVFVSLLLIPYVKKLLLKEERRESRERRFTLQHLWEDNRDAVNVYLTLFLGIYLTFVAFSFLFSLVPRFTGRGLSAVTVFGEQLAGEALRGHASAGEIFLSIATNNWWVLLACFLLALIAGDAAIFFIAWNASSWGSIFGFRAVQAAQTGLAYDPLTNLAIILIVTFPHVLLEGGAYILAAIAGGVLSDDIIARRPAINNFLTYFFGVAIVFFLVHGAAARLFRVAQFPSLSLVLGLLDIALVLAAFHFMGGIFVRPHDREVFRYNFALFVIAVAVFFLAVVVEVVVLSSSDLLRTVYSAVL
ncbi:hypothetical protein D6789_01275 [Candidatus Woesearchaeota archaeon]|nr:MAG: hypothetical protein D6789_01275 [Candidatus Woesearchaeota archaeon]